MYTCCPECKTCFRISQAQLSVAQGKVRCGKCSHIFNAKAHLTKQPASTAQAKSGSGTPAKKQPTSPQTQQQPRSKPRKAKPASKTENATTPKQAQGEQADYFDLSAYTTPPETDKAADKQPVKSDVKPDENPFGETTVISQHDYSDINKDTEQTADIDSILDEMNEQLSLAIDPTAAGERPPAKPKDKDDEELLSAIDMALDEPSQSEEPLQAPSAKNSEAKKAEHSIEQDFLDEVAAGHPDAIQTKTQQQNEQVAKTAKAATSSTAREEQIPQRLRDSLAVQPPAKRSMGMTLLGLFNILLLLLLFTTQLALFKNMELAAAYPELQPWLSKFCAHLPCRYNLKKDVAKIKLLRRDVRAHPKEKSALLISAAMVNTADFKQAYPDLMITLFDLSGNIVAKRRFTPADYMANLDSPFLQMSPNTPVQVALEVVDPGNNAINFEFEFL